MGFLEVERQHGIESYFCYNCSANVNDVFSDCGRQTINKCKCILSLKPTKNEKTLYNSNTSSHELSVLCKAILNDDKDTVVGIISIIPDVIQQLNESGITPLHMTVLTGNLVVLKALLCNDIPVNIMDIHGKTALEYAVLTGQFDVAQLLIEYGADTSVVRNGIQL